MGDVLSPEEISDLITKYSGHEIVKNVLECASLEELNEKASIANDRLHKLENESIKQHAKECDNLVLLQEKIHDCDETLAHIENVLSNFQTSLGKISGASSTNIVVDFDEYRVSRRSAAAATTAGFVFLVVSSAAARAGAISSVGDGWSTTFTTTTTTTTEFSIRSSSGDGRRYIARKQQIPKPNAANNDATRVSTNTATARECWWCWCEDVSAVSRDNEQRSATTTTAVRRRTTATTAATLSARDAE